MDNHEQALNEQIAYILTKRVSFGSSLAWVEHDQQIYYSSIPKDYAGPATAVTKLVQHLFDLKIDHSFFILRKRIFSTDTLSALCRGMVRLAAKRATGGIQPVDHQMVLAATWHQMGSDEENLVRSSHIEKIAWDPPRIISNEIEADTALQSLISRIPRGPVLHDHNRQIAVIICDAAGQVLEYATNNNFKNKTLHAEVIAIQSYFRRTQENLPNGAIVYVSLKPCVMCAAMISRLAPISCRVIYFKNDPGPLAQNTELESRGILYERQ